MANLFQHLFDNSFALKADVDDVTRSITLHPLKNTTHLRRIHALSTVSQVRHLRQKRVLQKAEVKAMTAVLKDKESSSAVANQPTDKSDQLIRDLRTISGNKHYRQRTATEMLPWDLIVDNSIFSANTDPQRRGLESQTKDALNHVAERLIGEINRFSIQRGRHVTFKQMHSSYRRVEPRMFVDYVIDVSLTCVKYRSGHETTRVRARIKQNFDPLHFREVTDVSSSRTSVQFDKLPLLAYIQNRVLLSFGRQDNSRSTLHFIVLADGWQSLERFMRSLEDSILSEEGHVIVTVLLRTQRQRMNDVKRLLSLYQTNYGNHEFYLRESEPCSMSDALKQTVSTINQKQIVAMLQSDIRLSRDALFRIRTNIEPSLKIYYPIVFAQYDPRVAACGEGACAFGNLGLSSFERDIGYWQSSRYDVVVAFASDFRSLLSLPQFLVGCLNEVDLFENILTNSNLKVIRSPDPGFVRSFNGELCPRFNNAAAKEITSPVSADCFNNYASTKRLSQFLLKRLNYT